VAEAGCRDTKNVGVDASKRNRTIRLTAILPSEIPYEAIESQVGEKVSGKWFPNCTEDPTGVGPRSMLGRCTTDARALLSRLASGQTSGD